MTMTMTEPTRPERRDTARETRISIHEMAAESFAHHVIEQRESNRWRCGRPGSSSYAFNVVLVPGHVIVFGDVGDAMLRCSYSKAAQIIELLRGAHWDYLCGKLLFREHFQHFYPDDALDWVREAVASAREHGWHDTAIGKKWDEFLRSVELYHRQDDLNEHEWHELVSSMGLDSDAHRAGMGLSSGAFWTVECLHKFVALYDAQPKEVP